jgi:hypothetical protein
MLINAHAQPPRTPSSSGMYNVERGSSCTRQEQPYRSTGSEMGHRLANVLSDARTVSDAGALFISSPLGRFGAATVGAAVDAHTASPYCSVRRRRPYYTKVLVAS